MTSHVIVVDMSLRRAIVKVTPGTYLTDVLEEACKKFGVQPTLHNLKHNNKSLDLSRTFRQSGLASGVRLELISASRSPTPVSVALQLPSPYASIAPNGRITENFSSDTTLWLVLRKFESMAGINVNFTARRVTKPDVIGGSEEVSGPFYEKPVLNLMGRELWKFGDLQKTLRQLGFSNGTCLIKLDFKITNQPFEEVMTQIEEYFKDNDPPRPGTDVIDQIPHESSEIENSELKLPEAFSQKGNILLSEDNSEEISKASCVSKVDHEVDQPLACNPDQRHVVVYAPPSTQVPRAATVPYNEADFEPTTVHAKLHQTRLLKSSQNSRLLSDAERDKLDRDRAMKIASSPQIQIKIRFPDQSSIVSTFHAEETGANIYHFTTNLIFDDTKPFKLTWHDKGPQTIPNDNKSLVRDLGFQNRMLVNFSWVKGVEPNIDRAPILKPEYALKAQEISVSQVLVEDAAEIKEHLQKNTESIDRKKPKVVGKWFKGLIKN